MRMRKSRMSRRLCPTIFVSMACVVVINIIFDATTLHSNTMVEICGANEEDQSIIDFCQCQEREMTSI